MTKLLCIKLNMTLHGIGKHSKIISTYVAWKFLNLQTNIRTENVGTKDGPDLLRFRYDLQLKEQAPLITSGFAFCRLFDYSHPILVEPNNPFVYLVKIDLSFSHPNNFGT